MSEASYPHRPGDSSTPIHPHLAGRWSPVRFDPAGQLSEEDLRGLLEAARWAPSCFGEEPWRFIIARREDGHRDRLEAQLRSGNAWAKRASLLVATLAKKTFTQNEEPNRWHAHDVGLATEALLTEATSRGLVTHVMGGFDTDGLVKDFAVPDDYTPIAMIAVGHYDPDSPDEKLAKRDQNPRRRRPLSDLAFGASFGEPYLSRDI